MTPRAGPLRILVVDDEPAIVRFLSASLESQGYLVSAAGNARTALDVVRKGAADLSTSVCPTWMVSMSSSKSGIAVGPCRL